MDPMVAGATPEELETLREDAIVVEDGAALARLFEPDGVLVLGGDAREIRGDREIAGAMELISGLAYSAEPRRLYQSRDVVLLIGDGVISVARRGRDRSWRFAISLLRPGAWS